MYEYLILKWWWELCHFSSRNNLKCWLVQHCNIAFTIEFFVKWSPNQDMIIPSRHSFWNHPFTKVGQEIKWQSKNLREAEERRRRGTLISVIQMRQGWWVSEKMLSQVLWERSRRETYGSWSEGVDISQLEISICGKYLWDEWWPIYLFEFPNRFMAEKILHGHWYWSFLKKNLGLI